MCLRYASRLLCAIPARLTWRNKIPDNSAAQIQVGVKTEVETDSSGGRPESEECPHLRVDFKLGGLLEDV